MNWPTDSWGPPSSPPGVPAGYVPFGTPSFESNDRPEHPTLPWQAGAGAVAVLVVSLLGSRFLLDALTRYQWPIVVFVVILAITGYGPSVAWWQYASNRWGSGRLVDDVGARPRWVDIGWAPVVWLVAILAQVAIAAVVIGLDLPLSNNTDGIEELSADRSYVIATVVTAVVAAPIVEEIVFRGLVMRSLLSKVPVIPAIVMQGLLFGLAHVDPVRGRGNIGLVMVLGGVGIAFGGAAYLLRRVGPTIMAHAIFNGVVLVLVLTGVAERLREDNPDPFGRVVPALVESAGEQVTVVDQADLAEPDSGGDPHRPG